MKQFFQGNSCFPYNWYQITQFLSANCRKLVSLLRNYNLDCWIMYILLYIFVTGTNTCYSVSGSYCRCLILADSISADISRSKHLSQPYNETDLTPLPFMDWDKDIPFNPEVSASSQHGLALFSVLLRLIPPSFSFSKTVCKWHL